MIFKHRRTGRFRQNFYFHRFRHRKSKSKFQNVRTPRPQFVEQSPLQRILLYGVTTRRVTWDEAWSSRKALKSRQRANFMILEASAPRQRNFFGKFHDFRKFRTRLYRRIFEFFLHGRQEFALILPFFLKIFENSRKFREKNSTQNQKLQLCLSKIFLK